MKEKYWVPAIERADKVLRLIGEFPNQLRLIELSKRLEMNKSSLFSLLNTLETLKWVTKGEGDTYSLGPALAGIGSAYFQQFNIVQSFYKEAARSVHIINEHIQLGILEEGDVIYLGKMEGDSRVRLVTDPGMRFPAHASAIGKMQLTGFSKADLKEILQEPLKKKTEFTISDIDTLYENLQEAKKNGYAIENQEASLGFHCVAAPVYNFENKMIASVSFTMMTNSWEQKREAAKEEILQLASRLSQLAGYAASQSKEPNK
ncbi:IclR family transcriptional regulator [Bacillus sp. USDA818B3_A]|uniref:IclR family transcriptional regulator n=1 Tax=Bacillus sp. USDA818B3_A TaxID=2698834 RepID=UPI001368A124|nr:IclR family transcriptional regulator [Bacillus sp. USDA818B3_A]